MAISKAQIKIKGKKPLLFHHFSVDAIPLTPQERLGVAGNNPDEWKQTVLSIEDTRQLYLDPTYIFGCIRDGGKHIKSGRGSIQPKVAATLNVVEDKILLDRFLPSEEELTNSTDAPVYIDIRSVKNPNTKGRNIRYRIAASPGWAATFNIEWENTIVSRGEMESALNSAGALVGIGDGRNIGFGRFVVEKFNIEESKNPSNSKKKK